MWHGFGNELVETELMVLKTDPMNTLKIKLTALSILILLAISSFSFLAAGNTNLNVSDSYYFEEYFDYEELNQQLELQLKPAINIKIFNSNNQLILTGNESEERVKICVDKSDLLTEIDGMKYYRLSYK